MDLSADQGTRWFPQPAEQERRGADMMSELPFPTEPSVHVAGSGIPRFARCPRTTHRLARQERFHPVRVARVRSGRCHRHRRRAFGLNSQVILLTATTLLRHSETHPVARCSATSVGSTCALREDEPITARNGEPNGPSPSTERCGTSGTWQKRRARGHPGPGAGKSAEQTGAGWGSVGLVGVPVAGIQPPRPPIQFGSAPSPPAGDRSTGLPPDHQFSSSLFRSFRAAPDERLRS